MQFRRIQNYQNIRSKLGYTENYYRIMENLKDIFAEIVNKANIDLEDANLMETGYTNVSILVRDTNKQKYLMKISADDRLFAEIFWYKKVYENEINVPKIIISDYSKKEIPFMYEVLEFIEGIHTNNKVSLELQYKGAYLVGQELRQLHKIPVDGFGTIDTNGKWTKRTWTEALKEFLDIRTKDKSALEIFTKKQIDKIYDYFLYDKKMEVRDPKLIHGDIGDDNFIYTPKENKITFLDPGSLIGGDPIFDLAYSSIPWSRKAFFKGIREGYEKEKLLTDEEEYRFERLKLICLFFAAVELYKKKWEYKPFVKYTKDILQKI